MFCEHGELAVQLNPVTSHNSSFMVPTTLSYRWVSERETLVTRVKVPMDSINNIQYNGEQFLWKHVDPVYGLLCYYLKLPVKTVSTIKSVQ